MAAIVKIHESNGPSGSETTGEVIWTNWGGADVRNMYPADSPIIAPDSGEVASFEKWWRVNCDLNGVSAVKNLKLWMSLDTLEAGASLHTSATTGTQPNLSYATPAATLANTPYTIGGTAPSAPNIGIGGSTLNSFTAVETYSDYFVHALRVDSTAIRGNLSNVQLSIQYDEVQ